MQDQPVSPRTPSGRSEDKAFQPSRQSLGGLDWFTFFLGDIQTGFGPFIAVYLSSQKWNQTDIGLVLSVGALASLVSQVPGGWLVDNIRSERSAAAAAVTAIGASAFMIAVWPVFAAVALARALHAAATAVLGPAIAAVSLGLVGRRDLAARLGRNARFASAGNGAAAVIMGAVGHFVSAQAVFFVTAGFTLPALGALFRIKDAEVNVESAHGGVANEQPTGMLQGLSLLLAKRSMWVFIGGIVLFQMANAPMLPLAGSELTKTASSWAVSLIAACIVLPQIIVALSSPWVGRFAQRVGRRPLLIAALAVLPVRGALLASFDGALPIVAIQALDGVSAAVFGVLIPLVIADISFGTGHFNLAQGVVGMSIGLAAAVSTPAAGFIADAYGTNAAFLALGATGGAGALLLLFFMPETRPGDDGE
jgi:MFS family permease